MCVGPLIPRLSDSPLRKKKQERTHHLQQKGTSNGVHQTMTHFGGVCYPPITPVQCQQPAGGRGQGKGGIQQPAGGKGKGKGGKGKGGKNVAMLAEDDWTVSRHPKTPSHAATKLACEHLPFDCGWASNHTVTAMRKQGEDSWGRSHGRRDGKGQHQRHKWTENSPLPTLTRPGSFLLALDFTRGWSKTPPL
jgi:hypothetical protein